MPLLPGVTLESLIRTSSHRLTVKRVLEIVSQICRGLQAAHERGLVHRDLKPSNIFVMDDDSVKIIDFGVAHILDADLPELHKWRRSNDRSRWAKAAVVLESHHGAGLSSLCAKVERSPRIVKRWIRTYTEQGLGGIGAKQTKHQDPEILAGMEKKRGRIIELLHEAPRIHGINRASWSLESLEAAVRALALDSDLGEAHSVLAYVTFVSEFDWESAERGFKRALELTPCNADIYELYARLCIAQERYDEAIAMLRRAHELDPMVHRADLATALLRAGALDEALQTATHVIELDPEYARGHATVDDGPS